MNKHFAGFLGAAAVLTMLAGCTAYDRTKDQFTQPVVKDVKGMSRARVAQIAGKPSSEVTMIHARGTCQTYIPVNAMVKLKPTLSPRTILAT